ncbi:oxygenase MpaB family protein [Gordonia alkanivorans]|uniref:oxygenase MpaB family protein n=1 Tax=Gordonia alkanivorans TaxID=84096 RepID=UPI0024B6A508|nr:oxygenase MpaB family protein [Gordonia alkanivorans]MDJ0029686.1 oxygenase MpaB family protein [Gordonia alkanivorans]
MTEVLNDAQNTCPVHATDSGPAGADCPAGHSPDAQLSEDGYEINASGVKAAHEYEPLGPYSLTWQIWGTWTGMFQGLWAGSIQNMHPKLGAAVWDHSDFFGERWQRLMRSLYPISGVVFDSVVPGAQTGLEVRDYHKTVKGTMEDGSRYHALDPDVFYWAHATFWYGNVRLCERFGPFLTEDQKRQLFEESKAWYAQYGVSMRPVPETYEDFLEYWDYMCRNVLRDHVSVRTVLDITQLPPPPFLSFVPKSVWDRYLVPQNQKLFMWLTTGFYDEPIREILGLEWTDADERRFRLLGKGINLVMHKMLPKRLLRHPRPRDAWDRVNGKVATDAPIVHTPKRNLPPLDQRDNPMHYCPVTAARRATYPTVLTSD